MESDIDPTRTLDDLTELLDAVDIWRYTKTRTSVVICISLSKERATVRIRIHPISLRTPYNMTHCFEAQ
jgi:hypothetical protein